MLKMAYSFVLGSKKSST